MFLARRPSRETIDRFLRDSQDLPLSYGPVGIVSAERARQGLDEAIVAIGRGETDFARARAALMAWKQFDIGWVETFPRHAPVAVGTVVAVLIRHLGFWSLNGCRVLYSVGCPADDARFGYAYGTLTNYAETGEELFEVFIDPGTDDVMYRIRATSWPQATLARVGQPIVRVLQARFAYQGVVREWYDDAARCFRIVVDVHNRVWGPLFGYRGSFNVEWRKVTEVRRPVINRYP